MTAALHAAYGANIAILVVAAPSMFTGGGAFQGKIETPAGLAILVGAFWTAILLCSAAGFVWPRFFAPILIAQVLYKAIWLGAFARPLARSQGIEALPPGVTAVFVAIVVTYPLLIAVGLRS